MPSDRSAVSASHSLPLRSPCLLPSASAISPFPSIARPPPPARVPRSRLCYSLPPNRRPPLMLDLKRRAFLQSAGKLSAGIFLGGAAAASLTNPLAAAVGRREPDVKFPTDPRARISVASWPFRSVIDSPTNDERDKKLPGMDLKDFGAHVRDKFNVTHIEPYNWHFSSLTPAYLASFRKSLTKAGVQPANIAVDLAQSYYDADTATRKTAVTEAK